MKLIAIELVGFGKWQQQRIEFLPQNQLLFGANEAGKSTIYQFIQAMLFGFPPKGKRKKITNPKMAPRMVDAYGSLTQFMVRFK
ncbi:ATP-binding protein [Enterococcus termitis]